MYLTVLGSMLGIVSEKSFSVHSASSSETVACQRYSKLNSTETTLPWPRGETSWSGSRVLYDVYISKSGHKVVLLVHHQGVKTPRTPVTCYAKIGAHAVTQYHLYKETSV